MNGRRIHRFGGTRLAQTRGTWASISVEHVTWAAGPGVVGEINEPAHQILVSLHGSAGRASVRCADGTRYRGHDFPGAVSFVPAGCHRVATYEGGTLTFVGLKIPADRAPLPLRSTALRPFTQEPDPLLPPSRSEHSAVLQDPTPLPQSAPVIGSHIIRRPFWPVMNVADRPAKETTAPAISWGRPQRPRLVR